MRTESGITIATGVGKADYSTGIESSVEPLIRSYQSAYSTWQTISVPGASDLVTNVVIPSGYICILYDFWASVADADLLRLKVYAVSGVVAGLIIDKSGFGSIESHLAKGFPFLSTIRFTVHNYSVGARDVNIGAVGIMTSEQNYYLTATVGVVP